MDDFVSSILSKWEMPDLIDTFAEQKIDETVFPTLTEKDISELIPLIGRRRKFLNSFNAFLLERSIITNGEVVFDVNLRQEDGQLGGSTSTETEASASSGETASDEPPSAFYKQKATLGLPYVVAPAGISYNSTVQKLIDTTEEGALIKASYKPNKVFLRNKLCELIIKNELKGSKNKKITSDRFIELANEVYDLFPHESPEIYYVPYALDQNSKPKAARGKLWHTYTYLRAKYKSLGLLNKKNEKEASSVTLDNDNDDKLLWLKNNSQPYETVKEYWLITFTNRNQINLPIDQYLSTFPILKEPIGYTLLELDFESLYPNKENLLYNKWPLFAKALLKICANKNDSFIRTLITDYERDCNKILDPDSLSDADEFFVLTLLPLFFPSVNLKAKKKNRWKPSRIEVKQGFILQTQNAADLEIDLQSRREKYAAFGYTEQPLPIVVGTVGRIEACYVKVNETTYKVEKPLKAVDLAFKLYHALNAEYPVEANIVWSFLEKGIYEISSNSTHNYVSVASLISDIKKILESVN